MKLDNPSNFIECHLFDNKKAAKLYLLYFIAVVLVYFSTFHSLGIVSDAFEYESLVQNYKGFVKSIEENPSSEISFWIILEINSLFGNKVEGVFFLYSFFSIIILIKAIQKFSFEPLMSMFIFIFIYYILYSLTYVRFSIALSIFLLALYDLAIGNNKKFFLKMLFTSFFHYSFFPLIILGFIQNNRNTKFSLVYFILPILGLLSYIVFPNLIIVILDFIIEFIPSFINHKVWLYLHNIDLKKDQGNLFTHFLIVKILVYYIFILFSSKIRSSDILLVKLLGWSIFLHFFLFVIPQFSVRYVAVLSIGIIILFINIRYINKNFKVISFILIIYSYYLFIRSFGITIFI